MALFVLLVRPGMGARRLTLMITLCVTLDFTSPFVPGAFRFNAEESVDGVNAHRSQVRVKAVSVPTPVPERAEVRPAPRLMPLRHEVRPLSAWLVDVRRAHSPTAAIPLVSEDH